MITVKTKVIITILAILIIKAELTTNVNLVSKKMFSAIVVSEKNI